MQITTAHYVKNKISTLSTLPMEEVVALHKKLQRELQQLDILKQRLFLAMQDRYKKALKENTQKTTDTPNTVKDDGYFVTRDIHQTIEWDQQQLQRLFLSSPALKKSVSDVLNNYQFIPEHDFLQLPDELQAQLKPARIGRTIDKNFYFRPVPVYIKHTLDALEPMADVA